MENYLRSLARNGRRPRTLATYRTLLLDFGEWLLVERVPDLRSLTPEVIERWHDSLQHWASPRTQQVASSALRGLLKWTANQELSPTSLWLRVAHPKAPELLPRPIPDADMARLQAALDAADDLAALRTRALFRLLFSSGARISEALSLDRDSFVERSARVIQKGGATHTLVISQHAQLALECYLAARADDQLPLFIDARGRRLKAKQAQDCWDGLCRQACVPRFTSHQLRHSCASTMLAEGVDWIVIARHLGHRGLQAIRGYAAVTLKSREQAVSVFDARLNERMVS